MGGLDWAPKGKIIVISLIPFNNSHLKCYNRFKSEHVSAGIGRDDSYTGDGDRRRQSSQQYPDTHQLFVGNLPLSASEDSLKVYKC